MILLAEGLKKKNEPGGLDIRVLYLLGHCCWPHSFAASRRNYGGKSGEAMDAFHYPSIYASSCLVSFFRAIAAASAIAAINSSLGKSGGSSHGLNSENGPKSSKSRPISSKGTSLSYRGKFGPRLSSQNSSKRIRASASNFYSSGDFFLDANKGGQRSRMIPNCENLNLESQDSFKAVAKAVNAAEFTIKGIKAVGDAMHFLQAPSAAAAIVLIGFGAADGVALSYKTVKMIVKGAKMSKNAAKMLKHSSRQGTVSSKIAVTFGKGIEGNLKKNERIINSLKASLGAAKVVRVGKGLAITFSRYGRLETSPWDLFVKSYEASKGALTAIEALTALKIGMTSSLRGFLSLKGVVEGIGVMIKALFVSKELSVLIFKGVSFSHGIIKACAIISEKRRSFNIFRDRKRTEGAPVSCMQCKRENFTVHLCAFGSLQIPFLTPSFDVYPPYSDVFLGSHETGDYLLYSSEILLLSIQGIEIR